MNKHAYALTCAALTTLTLAAPLPASLTRQWTSGYSSAGLPAPMEYYNPQTGRFSDASGVLRSLKLNADGTYESVDLMTVTTTGCTSKVFVHARGKVILNGTVIEFLPQDSLSAGYTCTPSRAYEKRGQVSASKKHWHIDSSSGKPVLVLSTPGGGTSRYDFR